MQVVCNYVFMYDFFCLLHSIACDFGRKTETMNFDITKKPKRLIHDQIKYFRYFTDSNRT